MINPTKWISEDIKCGIVRDNNFNTFEVTKKVTYLKGAEKSTRQPCLREIRLENDKLIITIPVEEIRMLRKNQHPKITLETSSLNYLVKKVLGYR